MNQKNSFTAEKNIMSLTRRQLLAGIGATAITTGCTPLKDERKSLLESLKIDGPALIYIASKECATDGPHNLENLNKIAQQVKLPLYLIDITPIASFDADGKELIEGVFTAQKEPYPGIYRYGAIKNQITPASYNKTIKNARIIGFTAIDPLSHSGNVIMLDKDRNAVIERNSRQPVNETIALFNKAIRQLSASSQLSR